MHLAEEAKAAAVAREQQRSVQSRAAELARANRVLQQSAARLAGATDVRSIATVFMTEALRASDASAAALFLERDGGFELVMIAQDGAFQEGEALDAMPCTAAVHLASQDPASRHFALLRAGEARWRFVDAPDTEWVGEALAYHHAHGHRAVWDIPFSVEGKVIGYLGLAFRSMDTPLAIVTETVGTLANQISVGLGLTTIAARLRESEVREAVSMERSRMARDIHDSLAQSFSSIAMQTEALLAHHGEGERLRRTLERIAETARHGIGEARATALALLPLENRVGALDEALDGLASRCTIQDGVACSFAVHGVPALLPLTMQEALLRIAQEAIHNALRHAGGTRVEVTVHYGVSSIMLTVQDDGIGMRADAQAVSGMGLKGMQQRTRELGGSFRVLPVDPHGTCVEVSLPHGGGGP
jgi:signal transduction histidine kinase